MKENSVQFPKIDIRIGIHTGNTMAGIIGSKMPRYYLFGETVKVACTMETTGAPGKIQISAATKNLLELTQSGAYSMTSRRGEMGVMVMYTNLNKLILSYGSINGSAKSAHKLTIT
jgi:class 3 adenylate cyclase